MQNRDLHVQLNKAREEVVQERAKAAAATGEETPTYSQQKAQAKLDAEAQLEIAKYKRLYTGGAERLGRLQQEKDKFSKEVITLQAANKELHGKLALLQDQLRSYHKSVRLPPFGLGLQAAHTLPAETATRARLQESPERDQKTIRSVEDRGGLVWKNRHREQSEQLARATADLEKTRLAAEAALGRREALERDIKTLRLRIKEMLDKSATDDELIAALTAERERYRAGCVATGAGLCVATARSSEGSEYGKLTCRRALRNIACVSKGERALRVMQRIGISARDCLQGSTASRRHGSGAVEAARQAAERAAGSAGEDHQCAAEPARERRGGAGAVRGCIGAPRGRNWRHSRS